MERVQKKQVALDRSEKNPLARQLGVKEQLVMEWHQQVAFGHVHACVCRHPKVGLILLKPTETPLRHQSSFPLQHHQCRRCVIGVKTLPQRS